MYHGRSRLSCIKSNLEVGVSGQIQTNKTKTEVGTSKENQFVFNALNLVSGVLLLQPALQRHWAWAWAVGFPRQTGKFPNGLNVNAC